MLNLIFYLIPTILLLPMGESIKVSFFGASYIAMPLQEAKYSTNIRLRFRTQQESAMIFLAAGRTDYCLLSLDGGRIKLTYKIDNLQTELFSPKPIKFNDLNWHEIVISRYETNLTLSVNEHFIRKTLPKKNIDLNIHFGVYIGGLGDFSESYITQAETYRGCLSDVYYNNINVFKRAREGTGHITKMGISWNCAPEFDAGIQESISFIEDNAYMMLTQPVSKNGGVWSFELKTINPTASVLYNTGSNLRPDYMALELIENKLRFLVGKGANAVELIPDKYVSDGKWHNITISYSPTLVEICVDDLSSQASFANGSSPTIELSEEFFVGGLELSRRRRAQIKGIRSSDISFHGCFRNIFAETKQIGLPSMKITEGVTVDCVFKYPCIEKSPCIISGTCQQYEYDDFICECDQAFCIKADYAERYKIFTKPSSSKRLELVGVTPLTLLEGDSIFLSTDFIDILFDYKTKRITEAGILFHITQSPKYGRIAINLAGNFDDPNSAQSKFFNLIDLSTDKVKYFHNGGEHFFDQMTIDLQIVPKQGDTLPSYLSGRHRFVLHVNMTPVNDPPTLNIPSNRILRLIKGIPKSVGNDLLHVEDPDSTATSLIYTVISSNDDALGTFQVNGKSINTFSQYDIDQGIVSYLVNSTTDEDLSFEIGFQVSDGMETSSAVFLQVSALPLQLRMINNTGLVLVHKSAIQITPSNLSFISNSEEDNIDIQFDVVQPPQYGVIQKLRSVDSSWIAVESFTSNQVTLGQIRYIHTTELPHYDEFKFSASLGPIKTGKYDFRLTFTKLNIGIQVQNDLEVNGTKEIIISCDYLYHQTTPLLTFPRNIIYTVIKAPKYGVIYVEGHPEIAEPMDSFTQDDIDRQAIRFRTHMTTFSNFVDIFEFTVSVPECETINGHLRIIYQPEENLLNQLSFQLKEKLYVHEGDRTLMSWKNFDILFNKFSILTFKVTEFPKHGTLCSYDSRNSKIAPTETFSLENLFLGDIYYCHDDSETVEDNFKLLVLSDAETDFQYVSEIQIEIRLQNDNSPIRAIDNIFHVVRSESKIISGFDLKYSDPDVNTTAGDIVYTHVVAVNGEFFRLGILTDTFSQEDLDNRKILFTHNGVDYGRANFIVTDGLYEVAGVFEIQASEPFLKIRENNASIVQEGKSVVIKTEGLSIETNLNSKPDDIEYQILDGPNYGSVKVLRKKFNASTIHKLFSNNTSVKNFTQLDIDREKLVYINQDVASMDKIKYRVTSKGIWTDGEILIRIYPAAYWELLQIRRNHTLYVEESTNVVISRDVLEIIHPSISPGDITYLVTTSPQHGYLEIQSITSDDEYNCKVFDQSTINSEKMFYIQAGVNQSSDHFIFDVTNGITWLRGLMLKIVIIPEHIYMKTRTVIVEEGKNILIEPDDMVPLSEFYNGKILEYKILQQPAFGQIRSGKSKVNRFTQKQIDAGVVYYVHDGSENSTDTVQIMAVTRNKESLPFELVIAILPVNDEVPMIITNTGLHMWVGGKSVIKNSDLMATDYDTGPDDLRFVVKQIRGGHLAIRNYFNVKITNFTQSQINDEQIFFVHDSIQINGKIRFYITDEIHNSTEQVLYITTNPVILELVHNEHLHVFPLTRKTIMNDQMNYRCSDHEREVKYVITIPPQLGRILYEHIESGNAIEVNEFTQNDIDSGRILYEHTHPMAELKSNDSFHFNVAAFLAMNLNEIFYIDISVSSGGLLRFLPVPRITLDEGESSPIRLNLSKVIEYLETRAGIQSPEIYIEAFTPMYGQVETLDGKSDRKNKFSLNDFKLEKVIYRHDHSDTTEDKILMSVFLLPGNMFLCNITIPVIINPVNDQPFHLVTLYPSISVVEGENKTITRIDLYTEDADTSPKDLIYDILSGPGTGSLLKVSDEGVPIDVITYGNQFTQKDINDNKIIYAHSGNPVSTSFYFRVRDGKFNPIHQNFNITILPISIQPDFQGELIYVSQGASSSFLDPKHISVITNANKNRIVYNITRTPSHGMILLRGNPTLRFSQYDLENEEVSYGQSDFTKSNDTFQVNAHIPTTQYGTIFDIMVMIEPFISINPISILAGDKLRLSSTFVSDPTNLKINRYNPKFIILKKPKYGKFKKIIRNSGEIETENIRQEISSFTYKELKSGVVYFVAKKMSMDFISINDSFEYILTMKSVQPGQKVVPIEIYSQNKKVTYPMEDINVTKADSGIISLNYVIIPIAITIVIIVIIIICISIKCILFYCLNWNTRKKNKNLEKDQPPTLPRPDLMTMNSNRMYSPSEADSIPITASSTPLPVLSNVPHCKVYPIGLDADGIDSENEDMMGDLNLDNNLNQNLAGRYPYGEDTEDWSSCDVGNEVSYSNITPQQQQRSNPLLRRNQYWV